MINEKGLLLPLLLLFSTVCVAREKDGSSDALAPFPIYFTPFGKAKTEIVELKDEKYKVRYDGKSSLRIWKAWYEGNYFDGTDDDGPSGVVAGCGCLFIIGLGVFMVSIVVIKFVRGEL